MNWATTAFVFPGQGSQIVGMGADFAAAFPAAQAVFQQADAILGMAFSELCFHGPEEVLNDTQNTQPALYICATAILRVLQENHPEAAPLCCAGHSLGEFTALTAAGALAFEDGLPLVWERARLMREAGEHSPGAMAALLGLEVDQARAVCEQAQQQTGGRVVLANDNCPGQVVISGEVAALEAAMQLSQARRAVKLAVSVAAHSPLMHAAAEQLSARVTATPFEPPRFPVYANLTAQPLTRVDDIRQELCEQLTQPVRWTESVQAMIAAGAETFIEIGPRDVLTGLLKRIDRSKTGIALNSVAALNALYA